LRVDTTLENKYKYPSGWLQDRWNKVQFRFNTSSVEIKRLIIEDANLAIMIKAIDKKPNVNYMLTILNDVSAYLKEDK